MHNNNVDAVGVHEGVDQFEGETLVEVGCIAATPNKVSSFGFNHTGVLAQAKFYVVVYGGSD